MKPVTLVDSHRGRFDVASLRNVDGLANRWDTGFIAGRNIYRFRPSSSSGWLEVTVPNALIVCSHKVQCPQAVYCELWRSFRSSNTNWNYNVGCCPVIPAILRPAMVASSSASSAVPGYVNNAVAKHGNVYLVIVAACHLEWA